VLYEYSFFLIVRHRHTERQLTVAMTRRDHKKEGNLQQQQQAAASAGQRGVEKQKIVAVSGAQWAL
jgi:hypothetical protein